MRMSKYTVILMGLFIYSTIVPIINHISGQWEVISRVCGVILLLLLVKRFGRFARSSFMDRIMLLYLLWLLFSGFFAYLLPFSNVKLWIYGLGVTGVPMLFYYIGRNRSLDTGKVLRVLWIVGMIHVGLGILIYEQFPYPSWWRQALDFVNPALKKGAYGTGFALRMMSVSGSLSFGVLSTTTLLLSLYFLQQRIRPRYAFYSATSLVGVFLSLQRSAWVTASFAVFIFLLLWIDPLPRSHFYQINRYNNVTNKANRLNLFPLSSFGIVFILLIAGFVLFRLALPQAVSSQIAIHSNILSSLNIGMQKRLPQQVEGWKIFTTYPLGVGLGQLGFTAIFSDAPSSYPKIPDGNYAKILGELGAFGFIFQAAFLIPAILLLLKVVTARYSSRQKYLQVMIVSLVIIQYYLQGIGTNVWDLHYVNAVFWLFAGLLVKEYNFAVHRKSKSQYVSKLDTAGYKNGRIAPQSNAEKGSS